MGKVQGLRLTIAINKFGQYNGVVSSIGSGAEYMRVVGCATPEEVLEACDDQHLVLVDVVYPDEFEFPSTVRLFRDSGMLLVVTLATFYLSFLDVGVLLKLVLLLGSLIAALVFMRLVFLLMVKS